jgi:hypothetical protein
VLESVVEVTRSLIRGTLSILFQVHGDDGLGIEEQRRCVVSSYRQRDEVRKDKEKTMALFSKQRMVVLSERLRFLRPMDQALSTSRNGIEFNLHKGTKTKMIAARNRTHNQQKEKAPTLLLPMH